MAQDNWLKYVAPAMAAIGGVYAAGKLMFGLVNRAELKEAIADAEKRTDARHLENLERFGKQDGELKEIRSMVIRIDERLDSGKYPKKEEGSE